MCYGFEEEIRLQDQRQEKMIFNKASENLVEIALVYVGMLEEHKRLSSVDSITWKQLFVQWANDYLKEIGKFAHSKILEYVGLEG